MASSIDAETGMPVAAADGARVVMPSFSLDPK
jgi:hypothetical protein